MKRRVARVDVGGVNRRMGQASGDTRHRDTARNLSDRFSKEDRLDRNRDKDERAGCRQQPAQCDEGEYHVHDRIELHVEGGHAEADIPVPSRHAEAAGKGHREGEDQHAAGEEIRLNLRQLPEGHLLLEDQRDQVVRGAHERDGGAAHDRCVEVSRHPKRVVHDDVDLFCADRHTRDPADESEHEDGEDERTESRVVPRRAPQPLEHAVGISAQPHAEFHAGRHGEPVDHRRQHGHVHEVAGVHDFPRRAEARIDEQVMSGRHRDEQDVEHERRPADLLVDDDRADRQRAEHVPDCHHGSDVDLLRRMPESPPHDAVDLGIDRHEAERPEIRRDVDRRSMKERDDRNDRRRHRAVHHQRQRSLIPVFALCHDEVDEEDRHADQRPDRKEDDAEIERRLRPQRHVRREEHVRLAGPHHRLDHDGAGHHEGESEPRGLRRAAPGVDERGAGEMKHGNLKEDDEKDQHAHAMHAEDAVEPLSRQQVNRLPSRQHDQHGGDGADEQRNHRTDRMRLDQALCTQVDPASRGLTGSKRPARVRYDGRRHSVGSTHWPLLTDAAAGASSTITRPTIMW